MTSALRVLVEQPIHGKRWVAVAADWPGLERGGKTEDEAVEKLARYVPRYVPVAKRIGLGSELASQTDLDIIGRYTGVGSTDFWGISFAFSGVDQQPMSGDAVERELTLMRACWTFFDAVRSRVSAELQRGPRGGGRDRDHIVRHTLGVEQDWATKLGLRTPEGALLTEEGLRAHRDAYLGAIRTFHAQGKAARTWPLRYLIRHNAFHTLDHAWEMEDKDLTADHV